MNTPAKIFPERETIEAAMYRTRLYIQELEKFGMTSKYRCLRELMEIPDWVNFEKKLLKKMQKVQPF